MEWLKEANKYFEVLVFTAGTKGYADPIIDYLDPEGTLVQHRLYRESCIDIDYDENTKLYVKDLRIFQNRDLKDLVIVDNAIISFAYQIDNGIPIISFKQDKTDIEFLDLMQNMKLISEQDDCRDFIQKAFKIGQILQTQVDEFAHIYADDSDDLDDDELLDMFSRASKSYQSQKPATFPKKFTKSKSFKVRRKVRKCKPLKKSKNSDTAVSSDLSQSAKIPSINDEKMTPSPMDKSTLFSTSETINKFDAVNTDNRPSQKWDSNNRLTLFNSTKVSSIFTCSDVSIFTF